MAFEQPPVLSLKQEDPSLELLSSIDSRLEEISKGSFVRRYTRKQPSIKEPPVVVEPPKREFTPPKPKVKKEKDTKKENINFIQNIGARLTEFKDDFVEKFKDFSDKFLEGFKRGSTEILNGVTAAILGPLNLVLDPIANAFGINFSDMFAKFFSGDDYKKKGKKVKPTDADVKQANPEIFWLAKLMGLKNKKAKDEDVGSMLKGLSSIAPMIPGILAKGGAIAGIAAAVIWSVIDGFKAVLLSDKWGTSKVSSFIGGFLAGTESGWTGAFKKAGKWALAGAGVGFLAAGPVGALAGGLIGAAVGGVLGFIGGENIAKGIDGTVKKVTDMAKGDIFDKVLGIPFVILDSLYDGISTFVGTIPKMIASIFIKDEKKLNKIGEVGTDIVKFILDSPLNPLNLIKGVLKTGLNIKNIIKDSSLTKGDKFKKVIIEFISMPFKGMLESNVGKKLMEGLLKTTFGQALSRIFSSAINSISIGALDIVSNVKKFIDNIFSIFSSDRSIFEKVVDTATYVGETVRNLFNTVSAGITNFFKLNPITKFVEKYVFEPVKDFFLNIKDTLAFLGSRNILDMANLLLTGNFGSELEGFKTSQQEERVLSSKEYQDWAKGRQNYDPAFQRAATNQKIDMFKKATQVNDAIITPGGRIITPSPQDTIIATKSPVKQQLFDQTSMDIDLQSISKSIEQSSKGNEIVEALMSLIDVVKDKPFNNIIQQQQSNNIDFNKLRTAL